VQYIYVSGKGDIASGICRALYRNIGILDPKFLYSIIDGVGSNGFGLDCLSRCAFNIREATDLYCEDSQAYIDSGGYSIMIGKVPYNDIDATIEKYNIYAECEADRYARIFSLDIPFVGFDSPYNTYDIIKDSNRRSLMGSRDLFEKKPVIARKFMFVWHFKLAAQYRIFSELYKELELERWIDGRAIGGMVRLKKIAKITFAPFVGIAYRCLADFMKARRFDHPFRLHYLGIYVRYDRFMIAVLEKLFARYLEGKIAVEMTYDSINPKHTAEMNTSMPIYHYAGGELICYDNVLSIPYSLVDFAYHDEELASYIMEEIERRRRGERLLNASSFGALNIKGNLDIDRFFMDMVDRYEICDLFLKNGSYTVIEYEFKKIISDLGEKYPFICNKRFCQCVLNTCEHLFHFHHWFMNDKTDAEFEELMQYIIRVIDFPKWISS
jgi:hypothetical protein